METKIAKENRICFHTNTIIEPTSWEIMGVSAKESENCIGFFGTGLKYAIAVLIRLDHQVTIHSGDSIYEFGSRKIDFRGKEFERITCNGVDLGFTTEYGKNWPIEHAYRELVSNTIDEGGIHYQGEPMEQGSNIVVTGDEFAKLMAKHEEYFIGEREPLAECKKASIYRGQGSIFYRGVRVGEVKGAHHSYELHETLELTEDRTIKHDYAVKSAVARMITQELKDKKILRRILTLPKENWEHDLDYDWTWSNEMSEVVKDLWENAPTMLNTKVAALVREKMPDTGWDTSPPDEDQQIMLDAAIHFLGKAGYPVTADIVAVKNEDTSNIGFVYNGVIHLTAKAFEKGLFYLTSTLMEEHFHTLGYDDESRRFENFLMEQVLIHAKKSLKMAL